MSAAKRIDKNERRGEKGEEKAGKKRRKEGKTKERRQERSKVKAGEAGGRKKRPHRFIKLGLWAEADVITLSDIVLNMGGR